MDEVDRTPMAQPKAQGVLGTVWLVAKKTGKDLQRFPIDADRVTIGRDLDMDIRLYFSDVSKLHCEIKFDLITGDASLHVHGTHGVKHAPQGGELSVYKPPSIIPLSNNDTFIIRKKLFRFEYGHEDALIDTPPMQSVSLPSDSPIKASPAPAPERRKRVSHRMSLVPLGKNFEPFASPMKSRRYSIIGLDEGPQVIRTPKKSGLAQQIEEEEDLQEEEEDVVIEAVDGEEGDVLYVETREEEEVESMHNNPFMTPQRKGKAPMRPTSAAPSTRQLHTTPAQNRPQELDITASPHTPRSVPLPPTADTPYGSVESTPAKTPRSVPLPPADNTPYQVTAQVAMSTPKGPFSLHKALLLRSARKAWQSSQAQNVEGAIVNGDITTKRKSLSPKGQARKSINPAPVEEESDEEEEEEDEDQEEGQLHWVYEDGRASVSVDESDESIDSLEADQSLAIPGQGIISFGDMSAAEAEEQALNESVDDEEESREEDVEESAEEEGDFEAEDDDEEVDELESMEEDQPAVEVVAAPNTPRRPLERFYTPQPQRTMAAGPRRSLASIGGPPTRLARLPETPAGPSSRMPATPGSLGPPSRKFVPPVDDEEVEDEEVDEAPCTPVKREVNPALLAEAKRRRETLGTPRALPTLPPSFKTPVREASLRNARTPSHPALAPTTPEVDSDNDTKAAVPMTPLQKVQKELNLLRRQSVQRESRNDPNRRATVSFALPSTPARPQPKASASYSVVGNRQLPSTFGMTMEEDEEASESGSPVMAGRDGEGAASLMADQVEEDDASEEESADDENIVHDQEQETQEDRPRINAPATPSFSGLKQMFSAPVVPKTPSFTGMRSMFAEASTSAPTPRFNGIKEMFHQPEQPSTPQMNGMKTMFALPHQQTTPAMEGLKEMYELEEVEQEAVLEVETESEEEEVVEGDSEIVAIPTPPKSRATGIKKPSTTTASKGKASATSKPAPSKVPVATAKSRTKAAAPASAPVADAQKQPVVATKKMTAPRPRAPAATKADTSPKTAVTKAETAPKPAAKKIVRAPIARPRPGDLDDVSLSEIEEPLEYREPVKTRAEIPKPTTSRTTTTRAKKSETVKAPAKSASATTSKSATTTTSRAKKAVLGENDDQSEIPAPAKSAPAATSKSSSTSRAKKAVLGENDDQPEGPAPAPAKATRAKKAVVEKETITKRKAKTVTEKENEPETKDEVVKKAPVKRAVKKVVEAPVEVVSTRTTRSRK